MGVWTCALGTWLVLSLICQHHTSGTNYCDADHTSLQSSTCRELREEFLQVYQNHPLSRDRKNRVICGAYRKFYNCMQDMVSMCPQVSEAFMASWGHVNSLLTCTCEQKLRGCKNDIKCMGEELHSVIYKRCQAYYEFQKSENIYKPCKIAENFFSCQHELMDSACGQRVARAALQISRFLTPNTQHCAVSKQHTGFRYTEKCSPDFPNIMTECRDNHLRGRHLLQFHRQNDLIATGGAREVRRACRALRIYTTCLSAVCDSGASLVYEMDGALRIYLTKVRYICERAFTEYRRHLGCLQSVVANQTLNTCNSLVHTLNDDSVDLTAQAFYCGHPSAARLHKTFGYLQNCFKRVYLNKCGREAGKMMADLMQEVRYDPYYLPYKFRATCTNATATPAQGITTAMPARSESTTSPVSPAPSSPGITNKSSTPDRNFNATRTDTTVGRIGVTETQSLVFSSLLTSVAERVKTVSAAAGSLVQQTLPVSSTSAHAHSSSPSSTHSLLQFTPTMKVVNFTDNVKNASESIDNSNDSDSENMFWNYTETTGTSLQYNVLSNNSEIPLVSDNETHIETGFVKMESESRKRHTKSQAHSCTPTMWLIFIGSLTLFRH